LLSHARDEYLYLAELRRKACAWDHAKQ